MKLLVFPPQERIPVSTFDRQNLKKSPRISFRVSSHAMERFRERVEEEFSARSDDDLADLLNDRLRVAAIVREVTDPREPEVPTTLYLFESRTGARQVAVVRSLVVVTVLDEWMARNNYPGWDVEPSLGTIGGVMGGALRNVVPVQPVLPSPAPPPVLPSPAPPPRDEYLTLAAECRDLAARTRMLREQKTVLEARLLAVTADLAAGEASFGSKRDRLLVLMTEDGAV